MANPKRDDQQKNIRPISLTRRDSVSISGSGAVEQAGVSDVGFPAEMALGQSQGPWRKDRATLSLEAQVVLMEMRSSGKSLASMAGQVYSNVISHLKVAAGRVLKLEPFGGYRLMWQNSAATRQPRPA